jgi:trafficking protein particle complex subunit 10
MVQINKLVFAHEPFTKAETTTPLGLTSSMSATSLRHAKKSIIVCYPRMETFWANARQTHLLHIGQAKSIHITCHSGWNDIEKAELRVRAGSAGLRLRTAATLLVAGAVDLLKKAEPGVISFSKLNAASTATFEIPYDIEQELSELQLRLEVTYWTSKGEFVWTSSFNIPVALPVDVNVHDHFKSDMLFSRFVIRTVGRTPLELLKINLDGTNLFSIEPPPSIDMPLIIFPKQPAVITYKITPIINRVSSDVKRIEGRIAFRRTEGKEASLSLTVEFRCLDDDVTKYLESMLEDDLARSQFKQYTRLLMPVFIDRIVSRILPQQLERIAMTMRMSLGSFESLNWSDALEGLHPSTREEVQQWLLEWHLVHF